MNKAYKVLGLMSGTSLDGLDLAYCHFEQKNGVWDFKILECDTLSYDASLQQNLKDAIFLSEETHEKLHIDYGRWLGKQAKQFLEKHGLYVDFIASHGHTSHHRPEDGITFQLGHGQELANASKFKVICDFRTLDVDLGGQGAPLVPIGDKLLFSEYDFCLNLGGISNISFKKDGKRMAFDVGMANMPLNYITQKIGLEYDEGGQIAQQGKLIPELLKNLNALDYYGLPFPKSTGIEWFTKHVKPLINQTETDIPNLLHTLIQHNAQQIAQVIINVKASKSTQVLVTGGGALNIFFMDTLQKELGSDIQVVVPSKKTIAYKEAMVFAFMGVLKELDEINVLQSVTGAKRDSSSGKVFHPQT